MRALIPTLIMSLGLLALSACTVLLSVLLSQYMHWGWAVAIASPVINLLMAVCISSPE
jgi:hypothetical protein